VLRLQIEGRGLSPNQRTLLSDQRRVVKKRVSANLNTKQEAVHTKCYRVFIEISLRVKAYGGDIGDLESLTSAILRAMIETGLLAEELDRLI
jgi:hypothetical protein